MTRHSVLSVVGAVILCAGLGFVVWSQPTHIRIVSPSESLQTAIDAAPEGSMIQLQARDYSENITIRKSLTLRGFVDAPEMALLGPTSGGPVVTVVGSSEVRVVLEGFTIHGARDYLPDGLFLQGAGAVACRSLVIRDCKGSGINVYGEGSVAIQRCLFIGNGVYGLTVANDDAEVTGSANRFEGNGADLGRHAPADLRVPLAEQTEREIVRVPEDYTTVQEAIDAVQPGGTVEIGEGEFGEGVTLWKDATLRGRGQAETLLAPLPGGAIGLSILHVARSCTLMDLTVASSGAQPIEFDSDLYVSNMAFVGSRGVYLSGYLSVASGGRLVAENSRFAKIGGTPIYSSEGAAVTLNHCVFEDDSGGLRVNGTTQVADCRFERTREVPIYAERGEFSIDRSTFYETADGIGIGDAQGVVRDCAFEAVTGTCLIVAATGEVFVSDCTFTGGGYGVRSYGESATSAANCVLTGAAKSAVQLYGSAEVTLKGCKIVDNQGLGVDVLDRGNCTISDSAIRSNGFGAWDDSWNEPFDGPGVRVTRNASLRMENVIVAGNAGSGVDCSTWIVDSPLERIEPESGWASVLVIGCYFEANGGAGLSSYDHPDVRIRGCEFTRHTFGILLVGTATVFVEESEFSENVFGIYGERNSELSVRTSEFRLNSQAGLMLAQEAAGFVEQTVFESNEVGILLTEATALLLVDSTIASSATFGISLSCAECWPSGFDYDPTWDFVGVLGGERNRIPDAGEKDGNQGGAICPDEMDRRKITTRDDSA